MPSYTSAQRAAIGQFVSFTQAKESIAARLLKSHDWDVERAVNTHYSGSANSGPPPSQQGIQKVFDKYREQGKEPDQIGFDGIGDYIVDLGVELDDVTAIAVFELVESPAMGEFTRENFVTGWTNVSSHSNPCDTIDRQKAYVKTLQQKLSTDKSYFKQIYKASFKYAKPEGQRAVPADQVFVWWNMFFGGGKGGINWRTSGTDWYGLWQEYYESRNKRPVNKDLWNQVAELVSKTQEEGGENLEWWSEDGAWPTAVDDFVAFIREKRAAGGMDTS